MNNFQAQFEYEFKYHVWKLTVNFLFFKKVNKHLHELKIYDGYMHYYKNGTYPYEMCEILLENMENYIEGSGDSDEVLVF